jgi:hypothetical protein
VPFHKWEQYVCGVNSFQKELVKLLPKCFIKSTLEARDHIHKTSFSQLFKNKPNKQCAIHLAGKVCQQYTVITHSSLLYPFVSYKKVSVVDIFPAL